MEGAGDIKENDVEVVLDLSTLHVFSTCIVWLVHVVFPLNFLKAGVLPNTGFNAELDLSQ